MTSPIPVWLLDIDGVINAIRHQGAKPPLHVWPQHQWIDTEAIATGGETWRILAAKPVVDFIATVHEGGLAEVRWHTTWQESAANVAQALGLPEFPVQPAPSFDMSAWTNGVRQGGVWWKVPVVYEVVKECRPVIWTDDDILEQTTREQRRLMAEVPFLVVNPDTYTGLTLKHLQQIRHFLEKHNERSARADEGEPVASEGNQG